MRVFYIRDWQYSYEFNSKTLILVEIGNLMENILFDKICLEFNYIIMKIYSIKSNSNRRKKRTTLLYTSYIFL